MAQGWVSYSDTVESYEAGFTAARGAAFGMSNDELRGFVARIRPFEASESVNRFAKAYAAGALDGVAPFMVYA